MISLSKITACILVILILTVFFTGCTGTTGNAGTTVQTLQTPSQSSGSGAIPRSITKTNDSPYTCKPNIILIPSHLAGYVPDIPGFSVKKNLLAPGTMPSIDAGVLAIYSGEGANSGRILGVVINDYGCKGLPKGDNSSWDITWETYKSREIGGFPSTFQDLPDDNRALQSVNIHDRIIIVFSSVGKGNRVQDIEKLNDAFDFKGLASRIE
jgi:hypothetical protein